ncbi:MAG: FAD-binding oxidoreductase [Candidatus Microsaccharimonas sp.]
MNVSQLVNKLLSIFSMYKGMSLGLLGIWAAAFAGSFFGLISYSPIELVASLLVLVVTTYGASYFCGKLFGVKAHGESSLITAIILSLIIAPTAEPGGLAVLAFAGILAGISKFILVYHGRHIFNPAALAAFIIGLVGVGGANWWVATPVLTPVVLLVILISLYKTHRFSVAGVFLATSIPILLVVFALNGVTFLESLPLLLSWPLLFMAGVMLTEPLTLPPRKWQMYIVAAIVAILFSIPLDLKVVEMTPALALLVGNIVAAIFLGRESITLMLKKRKVLTPTTQEYVFEVNKPLYYQAGQYIEIQLPHKKTDFRGYRRAFSFTSEPGKKEISLGIKFYQPSSSFKAALQELPLGATVAATGYWGDFVLPSNPTTPLLYVAGGIGVTPFISQLQASQKYKDVRDVVLVYAVRDETEIAYRDVLIKSGIKVVIVTEKAVKNLSQGWSQIKAARISEEAIAKLVSDVAIRQVYISGPTPFVQSTKKTLRALKVRHIKTDYFSGY